MKILSTILCIPVMTLTHTHNSHTLARHNNLGHLPFTVTPSIRVEILGVNIQCSSLSKRKLEKSEDVRVSIGKFKRKRKNAVIKPTAYNF